MRLLLIVLGFLFRHHSEQDDILILWITPPDRKVSLVSIYGPCRFSGTSNVTWLPKQLILYSSFLPFSGWCLFPRELSFSAWFYHVYQGSLSSLFCHSTCKNRLGWRVLEGKGGPKVDIISSWTQLDQIYHLRREARPRNIFLQPVRRAETNWIIWAEESGRGGSMLRR